MSIINNNKIIKTRLYLDHLHKFPAHAEISLMLHLMRQEFWVPKLKNLIKTIVHNCQVCSLYKKKLGQPIMSALQPERTTLTRPFTHTGIDFAGPFDIKSYIGRGCRITKGYVLVFVCFATRAIHLEATMRYPPKVFWPPSLGSFRVAVVLFTSILTTVLPLLEQPIF